MSLPLSSDPAPAPFRVRVPHEHLGNHIRYGVPGTKIVIGGPIAGAEDWSDLQKIGITHCLSVTNPPDDGVPGEALLHFHVDDDGTPFTEERLEQVADFAERALLGGGGLYVHCWVGASRSPSFAYAIMRSVYGMNPLQAMGALMENYPFGYDDLGRQLKRHSYQSSIELWMAKSGRATK